MKALLHFLGTFLAGVRMPDVLEALRRLPDLGDPYADERRAIVALLAAGVPSADVRAAARARALRYIDAVRAFDPGLLSAQNLLNSFPLATPEGIALLRLPKPCCARRTRIPRPADRRKAAFRQGRPATATS
jgi:hypothetical protein